MDAIVLKLAHTDDQGDAHPDAVWFPVQHTEDRLARQGSVMWYGYRDAAAFLSGLQPIGQHQVQVSPAAFMAGAASPPTGSTQGANAAALDIMLAMATQDTPAPPNPDGTPAMSADGTPKMQSFFQGATVVPLTLPD